jgi:hypothetical protein
MLPLRLKAKGRSLGLTMCKASLSEGGFTLGGVATSTTRLCVGVNILSEFVASMYLFNTT